MKTLENLAQNLKSLRQKRGLSQEQLALDAGIDQQKISKIEFSKVDIRLTTLQKIAKALNVSIEDLVKEP